MPAWAIQILVTIAAKVIISMLEVNPYVVPASVKGRLMKLLDGSPVGEDPKITSGEPGSEP